MKRFLQDLLGTSQLLDEAQKLSEKNSTLQKEVEILKVKYKTFEDQTLLQNNIEINRLFEDQNSNLAVIKDQINKLLPAEISDESKKELLSELNLTDQIKFSRVTEENLLKKIGKANLVSRSSSQSGLINSLAGIATSLSLSKFITKGLYTTTAKPEQLMQYGTGLYSSITTKGSQFSKHIGFSPASMAAMMPMLAFQAATIITSQAHLQEINKKLEKIDGKLGDLLNFHKLERTAKLKYINHKIIEFNERNFFTIEDFVIIEQFKYDLESIKEECFLHFKNKLNDKFEDKKLKKITENTQVYSTEVENNNKAGIFSKAFISVINVGKNLIIDVQDISESSSEKFISIVEDLKGSQVFNYAELSLTAEKLYESILTVEMMANLKVNKVDQDRIGKIGELRNNLLKYKKSLKFEKAILSLYADFKTNFENIEIAQKSKTFTKNKIKIDSSSKEFFKDLQYLEELLNFDTQKFNDNIVDAFEDDYEIIIDNEGEEELIYMRKIDNQNKSKNQEKTILHDKLSSSKNNFRTI